MRMGYLVIISKQVLTSWKLKKLMRRKHLVKIKNRKCVGKECTWRLRSTAHITPSKRTRLIRLTAVCLVLVFIVSLLCFCLRSNFGLTSKWVTRDKNMRPSLAGCVFAIDGCRTFLNSYKKNRKTKQTSKFSIKTALLAVICGVAPFCAGGGLLRDPLLSIVKWDWRLPWFISSLANFIQLQIIILLLIVFIILFNHFQPRSTKCKWSQKHGTLYNFCKKLKVIVMCIMVAGDVLGLIIFSQDGQEIAQNAKITSIILCYLFGLMTQIGGGFLTLVIILRKYSDKGLSPMLWGKIPYYSLAAIISAVCLSLETAVANRHMTMRLIIVPCILAGLYINRDTRRALKMYERLTSMLRHPIFVYESVIRVCHQFSMPSIIYFSIDIKAVEQHERYMLRIYMKNRNPSIYCSYHRRK